MKLTPVALAAAVVAGPRLAPGAAERVALAALVRQASLAAEARRLVAEARRELAK